MIGQFKLKSEFFNNVLTLMSGTALSQLIALLTIPVIARLYLPEDFGKLAVVIAFANIIGIILSLRYETAIMLPKSNHIAFQVLIKSILISFLMLFFEIAFLLLFFQFYFIEYKPFLYIIIVCSFVNIFFEIFILWFNRQKKFIYNSIMALIKVLSIFFMQFFLSSVENGLIYGYFFGNLFILIVMIFLILKQIRLNNIRLSRNKIYFLLKRYKKFPIYSVPASFMNAMANNIQFILIELFFGTSSAGIFSMLIKLVYAPVTLVAGSVNNVVLQYFTKEMSLKRPILDKMKKILFYMFLVSFCLTVVVSLMYQFDFFILLLGHEWEEVNNLLLFFLPLIFVSMVSKSISRFAMFERQEVGLYFQLLLMLSVITSIYLGSEFTNSFSDTVLIYSVFISIVFILQLNISLYLAKKYDKSLKQRIRRC